MACADTWRSKDKYRQQTNRNHNHQYETCNKTQYFHVLGCNEILDFLVVSEKMAMDDDGDDDLQHGVQQLKTSIDSTRTEITTINMKHLIKRHIFMRCNEMLDFVVAYKKMAMGDDGDDDLQHGVQRSKDKYRQQTDRNHNHQYETLNKTSYFHFMRCNEMLDFVVAHKKMAMGDDGDDDPQHGVQRSKDKYRQQTKRNHNHQYETLNKTQDFHFMGCSEMLDFVVARKRRR